MASELRDDLLKAYALATVNRSLGALKKALHTAWKRGRTGDVDYSTRVKRIAEHNRRTTYLSMAEVKKIADHASDQVHAAIWVALLTG